MERSTDTKTGNDDLEVYIEYGYVFVSSTGRIDVKMAASVNFKYIQWNLSVMTTSLINFITCDLFSNLFN